MFFDQFFNHFRTPQPKESKDLSKISLTLSKVSFESEFLYLATEPLEVPDFWLSKGLVLVRLLRLMERS